MEVIVSIIVVVFGVLQIILFFKIWGMTDDIKQIKNAYLKSIIKVEEPVLNRFKQAKEIKSGKVLSLREYDKTVNKYVCYSEDNTMFVGRFYKEELEFIPIKAGELGFKDNDEVIEIGSNRRMYINGRSNSGKYNCYAGYNCVGFIGEFSEDELKKPSK